MSKISYMTSRKTAPDDVRLEGYNLLERLDYMTAIAISQLDVIDQALPYGDNTEKTWQHVKCARLEALNSYVQYLESAKVKINQAGWIKFNDELCIGPWRPSRRTIGTIVEGIHPGFAGNLEQLVQKPTLLDKYNYALDYIRLLDKQTETLHQGASGEDGEMFESNVVVTIDSCLSFIKAAIERLESIAFGATDNELITFLVFLNPLSELLVHTHDVRSMNEVNRNIGITMGWFEHHNITSVRH